MLNEEEFILESKEENLKVKTSRKSVWIFSLFLFLISVSSYLFVDFIKKPPADFPINTEIVIPNGATVEEVASLLEEKNLVHSKLVFFVYFSTFSNPLALKASTYYFPEPLNLADLSFQLTQGNYGQGLLRLTHIEGESVEDLAKRTKMLLPNFSEEKFIALAKPYEGRLFPETYMIPKTYNEQELLDLLLKTFTEKTKLLEAEFASSSLSFDEVIILASILEREANSKESKEIVSGILQNRLADNMPLQTDATIEYVLHKSLKELTPEDLKIDSPYNTYLNKGLPPTPIGNPGLESIEAVLKPQKSEYIFYITGKDGNFYYAKNFDEHRKNIAKYLR